MFYNKIIGRALRQTKGVFNNDAPPAGSFFQRAWEANQDNFTNTRETAFIQGIADNTLNPEDYSSLTVVDIYYCYRAVQSLRIANERLVPSDELEERLQALYATLIEGYDAYNVFFSEVWHITQTEGIQPTENFMNYSDFEQSTAENLHPIYLLAAFIPCYYLWYELSESVKSSLDTTLYTDWINGNNDPASGYSIGNFIEDWVEAGKEWDDDQALNLYTQAMNHEFTAFNEAVPAAK